MRQELKIKGKQKANTAPWTFSTGVSQHAESKAVICPLISS
jgi:hypothetical protein